MFRKVLNLGFLINWFKIKLDPQVGFGATRDKTAATLSNPRIYCITGKEAGEELSGEVLSPNRGYLLMFGVATEVSKSGLIYPSPFLSALPVVVSQAAPFIYGAENQSISLTIQTMKQIPSSELKDKPLAYFVQLD